MDHSGPLDAALPPVIMDYLSSVTGSPRLFLPDWLGAVPNSQFHYVVVRQISGPNAGSSVGVPAVARQEVCAR
jgi:hypothetical protein